MEELAKRLAESVERLSPAALEAARAAVRYEVYSSLVAATLWAYVGAAVIVLGLWLRRVDWGDDPDTGKIVICGVFAVAGIILMCCLWAVVDPWTWMALANPDAWVAKKVLRL